MRDLIIFIAWVYINIGSSLLIWRGGKIYLPKDRLIAWALWPLQSWKLKKHDELRRAWAVAYGGDNYGTTRWPEGAEL